VERPGVKRLQRLSMVVDALSADAEHQLAQTLDLVRRCAIRERSRLRFRGLFNCSLMAQLANKAIQWKKWSLPST